MSKILVVDENIYEKSAQSLEKLGFSLIKMPKNDVLEEKISSHPDMSVARIKNDIFIDSTIAHLFGEAASIKKCQRNRTSGSVYSYPESIEFNCAAVGDRLICYEKYTIKQILEYANKCGMKIVNVKQGYSKCSVCVVNNNAIITEDDSIEREANKCGIDVLKISKGHVKLHGYDYGFIGGCSGLIDENLLAFNGSIEIHPDYDRIYEFCIRHCIKIISLSNENLYDIGSIIRIK